MALVEIILYGGETYWVDASECRGAAPARANEDCYLCHGTGIDVDEMECECVTHNRAVARGRAYERRLRDDARPADSGKIRARARVNRH